MKVLIVEDEPLSAERLEEQIKSCDDSIEVLAKIDSVENAVKWFNENNLPDLAFMDIQLADGISFEIFENVKVDCPVIFTTAYDEYALKAFKVNSVDYLLKPIDSEELAVAIEKFKQNFVRKPPNKNNKKDQQFAIDKIMTMLSDDYKERFVVKVGLHLKSIIVKDIACFYSLDKATFVQNISGQSFNIDYSLEQIEKLVSPRRFFRISRKYIVNIDSITDIIAFSGSRLKLSISNNNDEILVSRDKVNDFKNWIDR